MDVGVGIVLLHAITQSGAIPNLNRSHPGHLSLQPPNHILNDIPCGGIHTQIRSHDLSLPQRAINCLIDLPCRLLQAQKLQHDPYTPDRCDRVRDPASRNVWRTPVTRLPDHDLLADVRGRHEPEAADQRGSGVREQVAIEVRRHDDVVVVWLEEELVEH